MKKLTVLLLSIALSLGVSGTLFAQGQVIGPWGGGGGGSVGTITGFGTGVATALGNAVNGTGGITTYGTDVPIVANVKTYMGGVCPKCHRNQRGRNLQLGEWFNLCESPPRPIRPPGL